MRIISPTAIACLALSSATLGAGRNWNDVKRWVYQLCNYKDGKLDEIADADFDLAVVDLSRDGSDDYFAAKEIERVKASGKIVLAYFEIGAIEDYRPEWNSVPDDLKAGRVGGWPKEQYVKFWDERWWPIVKGRVDQALKAGFDGAYLDMVTTYEEIPKSGMGAEQRAHKMVDLIARISKYAKAKNPEFKIVPQNCPELYTWSRWQPRPNKKYIDAIDGLGMESVFYMAHDKPAKQGWCKGNRDNALAVMKAGKLVLGVDYARKPESVADAYKRQREMGFVPYVTVEELNVVLEEGPAAGNDGPRKRLHVYLLIGQSNMAGRAPFTKEESGAIPRCYLFNNEDKWEPAKNPLNRYSTVRKKLGMQKMNPGYTFAKTMLESNKALSLGLVVNAKGGTSIEKWSRESSLYKEALARTRTAQKTGVLKGVLWHQGEANAEDAGYLEKLKTLIANLREDLGEPNLPFVAGQVVNAKIVNDQIARLPDTVPFTGFAGSEGLKAMDRWHFDAGSMRLLGRRYAEAMLKIRRRSPQASPKRAAPPAPPERPAPSAREKEQRKAELLFKTARRAERMGQRGAAVSLYSKIVKDYPETSAARSARERLDSLRQ